MASIRANPRLQVGSMVWLSEERTSTLQLANAETEEFMFSARNEVDWLNEHMAEIFSKNQMNVVEIFKTPGKLRGKTPRTVKKNNALEPRAPLSDVFSSTPRGTTSPFRQIHFDRPAPTFKVAEDEPRQPDNDNERPMTSTATALQLPTQSYADSGYYGSQLQEPVQCSEPAVLRAQPKPVLPSPESDLEEPDLPPQISASACESEGRRTTDEGSFQSAKEEQVRNFSGDTAPAVVGNERSPTRKSGIQTDLKSLQSGQSHMKISPTEQNTTPEPIIDQVHLEPEAQIEHAATQDEQVDDIQSPSEGSSPIRPIVRKSSLNFASLPAREPITTKKSIGSLISQTNHIDQARTSYYPRHTEGKGGNIGQDNLSMDDDEMNLDAHGSFNDEENTKLARLHNKTSTQRLQDQISMLGQSQSNIRPPGKSLAAKEIILMNATQSSRTSQAAEMMRQKSPGRKERPTMLPGAFPDDEDESWIGPPNAAAKATTEASIFSPRPVITKSYTADVMEDIRGRDSIGGSQFNLPKQRANEQRQRSPLRQPAIPERTTSTLSHIKSVSTSVLRSPRKAGDSPGNQKAISVSNPNPSIGMLDDERPTTPPKSPSRSHRGSPLKAAKDKFSSILKTSRGLFASSAAVSADAKAYQMSPATSRTNLNHATSHDTMNRIDSNIHLPALFETESATNQSRVAPTSPGKASPRKTRASTEREERRKQAEAAESKGAKEAQKMERELEKARLKVKEEARVYHLEQERVVAMQREIQARKELDKQNMRSQEDVSRATRTSPRKTKAQLESEGIADASKSVSDLSRRNVDTSDTSAMPPPVRPKSQIGRPPAKRPLKPAKEATSKTKQPPTVIRVDTGSQRGHQYHPSTTTLAATLQESLSAAVPATQGHLRNKASISSIQSKASTSSFKSQATKALEAAARKKEQDELAAQRKREAKQEVDRQRAVLKEEERRKEEQARRQEAERQRQLQRERDAAAAAADAKKAASRLAIEKRRLEMEKAKETRAPPPAARVQPSNNDLTQAIFQDKALPPAPAQRDLGQPKAPRMNSTVQRSQEEFRKSVNAVLHNTTKAPPKRPLQQDPDEHYSRPTLQRSQPSYHHNEPHTKRRKTSETFDDDDDMSEIQPKMTAPPIRNSSVRPKDTHTKSLFPSGYANAPPPNSNLQRTAVLTQHNLNHSKPTHPLDMAQVSKAPIPFASSSSQANIQPHKTPARPGAPANGAKSNSKSNAKSSPRYQNGENIDLPEIMTDEEDEDEESNDFVAPGWTNSPDLRKQLALQETLDPAEVFGQPGPLNMEEVFSKSKDRWHKFRARTSSANWSGQDRLTEEEVKKDLEARDRVRRQGGWTYDSMV